MVDRDALAVRYAAQNALLNGIDDALAYPSIGFDDVGDRDFDLIAANIPGKAGETVIASWLREAPLFLRAQGQVAVVVVSPLAPLVEEVLDTLPGAEVVLRRRGAGHTVVLYAVDGMRGPPLPRGAPLTAATTTGPTRPSPMDRYGTAWIPFSDCPSSTR